MDRVTQEILDLLEEINCVPRCSGHEEKIANWLKEWSLANGLNVKFDSVNNILIRVPASKRYERSPVIVIQGHMDMVCEKDPDSSHDFTRDPIEQYIEGDWLKARGTTLGADNGFALALALVLAKDKDLPHPPLELLFTVDEETGLTGANELMPDFISGKILLNLDSEDEGVFIIGCAGGLNTNIRIALEYTPVPEGHILCRMTVGGLAGGHSGVDIHEKRANANKLLATSLDTLLASFDIYLINIEGGSAHNAIPRHAEALFAISQDEYENALSVIRDIEKGARLDYRENDPLLSIGLTQQADKDVNTSLKKDLAKKIIDLLVQLPDGVARMSEDVPGLVETSNNLATMRMEDEYLAIISTQRSSADAGLSEITKEIEDISSSAGAIVLHNGGYPAWQPDIDSSLLQRSKKIYMETFGEQARTEVIHAGLECAVIGSKFPDMDMISFGPTIKNPHSPDERLHIPSVLKLWKFLTALLASFSGNY
ncbi:aminoacyl-histidine dipeptidase [Methanolobus halotolerans]|uniref:Aminoacyl-histidine dipeptidase n=1 Tax=Methanolobus halotolerans TaxID=2052935 RepID=A0A4E0PTG4_9EURY|nr:aminoacyl-histidine dipeptidase [Methanolobus halotolerans]TGC07469.1 aminoacyl-histidine dipeptidase [Methanolobus halotolerans]